MTERNIYPLPGGLTPWLCEYRGADGLYGIVLYGSDPDQVVQDNAATLPGLRVLGEAFGKVPREGGEG